MASTRPKWLRLDNAAKIYPAAKRRKWVNFFRVSITLKDEIDPYTLQIALNNIIKRFPSIAVRIKFGMFWYYLEPVETAPKVKMDKSYPCTRVKFKKLSKFAFRVLYYKNRIAVELFHGLTDGNGGMIFLKSLAAEYIDLKYKTNIPNCRGVLDLNEEPSPEELEDSFLKYVGSAKSSRKETNAYRLKGRRESDGFLNLTCGILDTDEILAEAKRRNVSLTVLLTAVMIEAIEEIQSEAQPERKKQKPVKVLIPVNLRNFFESSTLRNFAQYITPGIDPRLGEFTFDDIIKSVHHQMGAELNRQNLASRFTTNVKTEEVFLLKIMPLFIKNLAMKTVYNMVGERKSCINISNLGVIDIPDEMKEYVERFDFILGVQATIPCNCSVLSYNGKLYINFIRNIKEPVLERKFFTRLRKLGLHVKIESNSRS